MSVKTATKLATHAHSPQRYCLDEAYTLGVRAASVFNQSGEVAHCNNPAVTVFDDLDQTVSVWNDHTKTEFYTNRATPCLDYVVNYLSDKTPDGVLDQDTITERVYESYKEGFKDALRDEVRDDHVHRELVLFDV